MSTKRQLKERDPKDLERKFTQPESGFILVDRGEVPPDNDARIAEALGEPAVQVEEEPEVADDQ